MSGGEVDYGGAHAGWDESGRGRSSAVEFAFVAALEREVADVVRGWTATELRIGQEQRRMYYSLPQRAVLVCAGTGRERAYSAAKACIEELSPRMMVSLGFAGACVPELAPGSVVVPARLAVPGGVEVRKRLAPEELATISEFPCAFGSGTLVSLSEVAGAAGKQQARAGFGALAVEMEAAGIAAAAAEFEREFLAIKAISDGVEDEMDFLSAFVTPEGFATGRFLAYAAVRPRLWPRVAELNRNSRLAAEALERAVDEFCSDCAGFAARHS